MFRRTYAVLTDAYENFLFSDSFTRGAAIAFYSVTSMVPVMVIVIAVAGIFFGEDAAKGALVRELTALIGGPAAELIQGAISSAYASGSNLWALVFGTFILLVTASGVFIELQAALNAIWRVPVPPFSYLGHLRDRLAGLGLIVVLGFLLLVSLVVDAGIGATGGYIARHSHYGPAALSMLNAVSSYALTVVLFAAIYRVLPDTRLSWREIVLGSLLTAIAFQGGKAVIGLYLGRSTLISSYGAAGALASVVLWIYYSAQIFLLCAAFTRALAGRPLHPEVAKETFVNQ